MFMHCNTEQPYQSETQDQKIDFAYLLVLLFHVYMKYVSHF